MMCKRAVVAMAMAILCARTCFGQTSETFFVSSEGTDSGSQTHVLTIQFALDQNFDEVTINLAPETFTIGATLTTMREAVTMCGASQSGTVVAADGTRRVMTFTSGANGNVTLESMTIRNGHASGGGGCILMQKSSSGMLTIRDVHFEGCTASNHGAVFNTGPMVTSTITDSVITGNSAGLSGMVQTSGGIQVFNTTIVDNTVGLNIGFVILDGIIDTVMEGLYVDRNVVQDNGASTFIVENRDAFTVTVRNSIFRGLVDSGVVMTEGPLVVESVEARSGSAFNQPIFTSLLGTTTIRNTLISGELGSSPAIDGIDVVLEDVILNAGTAFVRIGDSLSVTGLVRNNGGCDEVFLSDATGTVTISGSASTADFCGACAGDVDFFVVSGGTLSGTFTLDGTDAVDDEVGMLQYTSANCSVNPLCGSGVYTTEGTECSHATLESTVADCMGDLDGDAFVDVCGMCVPRCNETMFYTGDCGSRVCVSECPDFFEYDPLTKACIRSVCPGATSCAAGEELVDCIMTLSGDAECVTCGADTYENSSVCTPCAHTPATCAMEGFAFTACGSGESSDVSTCTDCTALRMFVSGDGASCTGSCSVGSVVTAGGPGETNCDPCPEDTYQNGAVCDACASTSATCDADGLALEAACGTGETSDVSTCTNCTALGMFVSANGTLCEGNCSAGSVPVAGAPGDVFCNVCGDDTYQSGVECVSCAVVAADCNGTDLAFTRCVAGQVADVSMCTNCTSEGLVVSGTTCVSAQSLLSDADGDEEGGDGLSGGGIAGIVISLMVVAAGVALLLRKHMANKFPRVKPGAAVNSEELVRVVT